MGESTVSSFKRFEKNLMWQKWSKVPKMALFGCFFVDVFFWAIDLIIFFLIMVKEHIWDQLGPFLEIAYFHH